MSNSETVTYAPDSSCSSVVRLAQNFTDKRFIENVKLQEAKERHPYGQNFRATAEFQLKFNAEDEIQSQKGRSTFGCSSQ